jgi:predicted transcriptional regulator
MNKTKLKTFKVEPDVDARITEALRLGNRSLSDICRDALMRYVRRVEKEQSNGT